MTYDHGCGTEPCVTVRDPESGMRFHVPDPSPETTALIKRLDREMST